MCQKNRRFGPVVAAAITVAAAVGGCSDNRTRRAGRDLRARIDKAQRLCNRAMTLMRNAVFVDRTTGEAAPLSRKVTDPGAIEVLKPTEAVNPKAIEALDKAASMLRAAIAEHAGRADRADLGLAHMQQARVHALRAHYHAALAAIARDRAQRLMRRTEQAAQALRAKAAVLNHYGMLAAEKNRQAMKRLAIEKQKAEQARDALAKIDKQVADLRAEKRALVNLMNKRAAEARAFRVTSRQPGAADPMAQLERALAKQSEANKAAARIAEIENQIDLRDTRRATLELQRSLAESIQRTMQAIIDAAKASVARGERKRERLEAAIADQAVKVEQRLRLLKDACKDLGGHETLAEECLGAAVDSWRKAQPLPTGSALRETAAEKGDTHMAWAELGTCRLRFRARIDRFAEALKSLWRKLDRPGGVPPALDEMGPACLADPAAARKQAETQYQQAIESYGKALSAPGGKPHLRWAYQGQLATAYIGLYKLTGDGGNLDQARDLLDEALKDKQSSPYLKSLLWFRGRLRQ